MTSDVVFIGGRSGTGKTSVSFEMHAQLSATDVSHCLIDGDFLDMAHPAPWQHHLAERNLAAIWANYQTLGYHRMIYTNTVCVLPEELARLTATIGDNPNLTAVLLTCTDATARTRLSQREIGSALDRHLASSNQMSTHLNSSVTTSAHHIPTDDRTVSNIAADIITLTGWKNSPDSEPETT
jgi:cytidylate kinase